MRILFIDDRPHEIEQMVERAGLDTGEVRILVFASIDQVLLAIAEYQPEVILVGHGLGANRPNGDQVAQAILLLEDDEFNGYVVGNSGGGEVQWATYLPHHANRQPDRLRAILATF